MGIIQDQHGRPLESSSESTESNKNGHDGTAGDHREDPQGGPKKMDVRCLSMGTLFYNLNRVVNEEMTLASYIQQMEQQKEAQRVVVDPPQLVRMKEVFVQIAQHRFVLADEVNTRFHEFDLARATKLGLKLYNPKAELGSPEGE